MIESVVVKTAGQRFLKEFLLEHEFRVEEAGANVLSVRRADELPVFITATDGVMFFEVDLGNVSAVADKEFYFKVLDLNTEILPVSIGIDTTNPDDPRLVLIESRETGNLDQNEVLSVLDALELAVDKAEVLLTEYVK